jgi:hypothetical protein
MTHGLSISWHDFWRFAHVWIYLLKWPIAFVAGWAGIHYQRWRKQRAESRALGWPSVNGRISGGAVKPIPKTKRSLATLNYTYYVGEYYTGTYVHEFENEDDADEFVRVMKDKQVPIRYQESNPAKSVLEQRTVEQYILLTPRFG